MAIRPGALGRKAPETWEHVEKYPLTVTAASTTRVPFAIGVNWYTDFDSPEQYDFPNLTGGGTSKRWMVAKNGIKGSIRGGHCVCIKPGNLPDRPEWYKFYDQGNEGACVGFGSSRMMSLLNKQIYNARWLWDQAKMIDPWGDTNPGDDNGTSVDAALQILSSKGHVKWDASMENLDFQQRDALPPTEQFGISAYRWTQQVDDIRKVLASPLNDLMQAVPFVNSWGVYYPHIVWLPYEALQRLLDEDGEAAVITDR